MQLAKEFKARLDGFLANPEEFVSNLPEEESTTILNRFGERCAYSMQRQFFETEPRVGEAVLSPSSLGKCVRMLAYAYHGYPQEGISAKLKMTFLTGDLLEAVIYAVAEFSGWPIENIQKVVYPFGEEGGVKGSIDGMLGNVMVDVKTSSLASFDITKRLGVTDGFGYLTQIALYKEGVQSEEGIFVYVNKNTGEIAVHSVPHDPDLVRVAKMKYDMVRASTPDRLPPRPHEPAIDKKSKRKCLPFQCKFCNFKTTCWNVTGIGKGYNNSEVYYV